MKNWLMLFSCCLFFLSCEKDDKDELEGKWQLNVVTDADGIEHRVDTVWYNVQNTLFMYQLYDASKGTEGTYLQCYGFKIRNDEQTVRFELEDANFVKYTDWDSAGRTFAIEEVNGSRLILKSSGKLYKFSKF